MSNPSHANIAVRLPDALADQLEQIRVDAGARSLNAVVERVLIDGLDNVDDIPLRRQPLKARRRTLFLPRSLVMQLRSLADEHSTEIGSLVYSVIAAQTNTRPARLGRTCSTEFGAQAA